MCPANGTLACVSITGPSYRHKGQISHCYASGTRPATRHYEYNEATRMGLAERSTRVRPLHVAYSLIGLFVIAERLLRRGSEARSWEEKSSDRGTTRGLGLAFGTSLLALLVMPLLNRMKIGRLYGTRAAWGGIAVMSMGLALRIWAAFVLGASYTRTLRTNAQQSLVKDGPYRLVRHPGYLGNLLLWLGAAIATANEIAAVTIAVIMGRAYHARIIAEEAMLAEAFTDDYQTYSEHTWRLLPFVY